MERVAVIWKYQGKDRARRLGEIEDFRHRNFKVIPMDGDINWMEALRLIPHQAEGCLFWIDDDKPVGADFVQEMMRPLSADEEARAALHFWSGNALAAPKDLVKASSIEKMPADSLWRLISPLLDVAQAGITGRVHVEFSSTERFAPLCMDPVGFPS